MSASHICVACVCVCFCLAALPVNELVTCISHSVPRYFLLADCFLPPPLPPPLIFPSPPPLCPCFPLSWLCFVYSHSGWKSQTQEDAARNKALLSPFFFFFPFFCFVKPAYGQTGDRACLGFPNSSARGPWRVTPP